jgi:hypothetical protein
MPSRRALNQVGARAGIVYVVGGAPTSMSCQVELICDDEIVRQMGNNFVRFRHQGNLTLTLTFSGLL